MRVLNRVVGIGEVVTERVFGLLVAIGDLDRVRDRDFVRVVDFVNVRVFGLLVAIGDLERVSDTDFV